MQGPYRLKLAAAAIASESRPSHREGGAARAGPADAEVVCVNLQGKRPDYSLYPTVRALILRCIGSLTRARRSNLKQPEVDLGAK